MLEYRVLGSLSVTRDGEAVDLNRPLERRLLAVLLINRSRVPLDDQIVEALWPERLPGYPGQALRTSVSRLRKMLGAPDSIVRDGGGYRLAVEPGSVDADRFETLLAGTDPGDRVARLREALDLWTSEEAYADFRYDDFVLAEATRLQGLRTQAYEDLFAERLASGESHELIPDLQLLVRQHPHREPFYGLLMLALYRAGQQPEALQAFQVARSRLGDDLGLEPSKALIDLEHQILVQDPDLSLAAPAMPNNIPSRIAPIVGREADIDQLCMHLRDRRLVTVTGPVGVGKSAAAIESARRIASEGQMESWYIDLAAVTSEDRLAETIADRLATLLDRSSDRDWEAFSPGRLIGSRKMLIVLDNCEHVIDRIGTIAATILKECPNAAILATSRERLRLPGELLCSLAPLPAGAEGDEILDPHHAVENYPALQLFAECARAASSGFRLSPADVPAALRLCRRLDGLPLAIELAAAMVTALAIAEIDRQIEGHYTILSSQRGVETHHQSLEAAIAWSYDLLDEQAQESLQVLARVSGPFTITDAAHLLGIDDKPRVAATVASLREKSLLRTYGEISEGRQFAMLGTLREFATARGVEAGKEREHELRHARCFLSLAEQADQHLRGGPDQLPWLKRCEQSTPDFLHAVETFLEEDHVEEALDLLARVGIVWTRNRPLASAYSLIRDALAAAGDAVFDCTPRAHVIASWINTDNAERQFRDGWAHAQHALRTSNMVGDVDSASVATALIALNQWLTGQSDDARESVTAARRLAAGEATGWAETFVVLTAGIVEHALQPSEATSVHLERAAELAIARSDEISTAWTFAYLGSALKDAGHHSRACAVFRKAYESGLRIKNPEPAIIGAAGLALASWLDHDAEGAAVASDRALELLEPLTAVARYAPVSSLYLGYQSTLDLALVTEALRLVFAQPPAERTPAFLRFLLEVAEKQAVEYLDPARVEEIEAGLTALDRMPRQRSA